MRKSTMEPVMTAAYGKLYVDGRGVAYTLTPNGNVICKLMGHTKWVASAMGKALFEINIESGHLVPYSEG